MAKAKRVVCGLERYDPTPEQTETFGRILLMAYNNKLIIKEADDGYLAYHSRCNTTKKISKELVGQAKKSHVCPFCFSPIDSVSTKTKDEYTDFCQIIPSDHEVFGYYVMCDFELGKPLCVDAEQTYYACGDEAYYRYMGIDVFGRFIKLREDRNDWRFRKRFSTSYYYGNEHDTYSSKMWTLGYSDGFFAKECKENKRAYLEDVGKIITKSNQKKLAIDNLFNETQIKFIKAFDLKTADDVYRNNGYMNKNGEHVNDLLKNDITLNVFYLDYLRKKKIDLGSYFTYLKNLKELGFKYDKPTDFDDRYKKVEEMVKIAKDKAIDEKCLKRYNSLPKYSEENITIEPFKTAEEIRRCGKTLHNCIGGYVTNYADGTSTIFHLDLKGKMKVAIEIKKLVLIQAMLDGNKPCNKGKYFNAIKSFCNENGFSLGKFA